MGFKLTTLKVIGTDFTGSCKSYYYTINATTIPGLGVKQYYTINATMTPGLGVKQYLVNVLKKVHVFQFYM
jgi:hypothetical protein